MTRLQRAEEAWADAKQKYRDGKLSKAKFGAARDELQAARGEARADRVSSGPQLAPVGASSKVKGV